VRVDSFAPNSTRIKIANSSRMTKTSETENYCVSLKKNGYVSFREEGKEKKS